MPKLTFKLRETIYFVGGGGGVGMGRVDYMCML